MSDQHVIDPYPDPLKLSMTGARKVSADLNGSAAERLVAQLEMKGVPIPPHSSLKDLQNLLFQAENREQKTGTSKQDRLYQRWSTTWNQYCKLLPVAKRLGLPSEFKIKPKDWGHTEQEVEQLEQIYNELSHEVGTQESMTPAERRLRLLETRCNQLDTACRALFDKLNECVGEINRIDTRTRGGPFNALLDTTPRVVVDNGDSAA